MFDAYKYLSKLYGKVQWIFFIPAQIINLLMKKSKQAKADVIQ